MANLTDSSTWEAGIYQLETTDPVLGGAGGVSNQQPQQLANRTRYLYDQLAITNSTVSGFASSISTINTALNSISDSWQIHKRHCVLDGPIKNDGNPSLLKNISGVLRKVGFDLIGSDIVGTEYAWLSFSDGYKVETFGARSFLGAVDYVKRIYAANPAYDFVLPATNGDFLIIAKYNSGTGAITLDYVNSYEDGGYMVQAFEPTVSSTVRALWFNPFTQKHKITTDTGASWTDVICIPLAKATIAALALTTVTNYDYQTPFYDFNTPPATVLWQAAESVPMGGYLYCDGSAVSRTGYQQLFRKVGTTYGVGDGSTTFKLPDLRGYFVRGFDDAAGVDTGRVFGSAQQDAFESHAHDINGFAPSGTGTTEVAFTTTSASPGTGTTELEGDTETRPKNIAFKAWIKF